MIELNIGTNNIVCNNKNCKNNKIGFGTKNFQIDVVSIRTMLGLCYKLNFSKSSIPIGSDKGLLNRDFGLMMKSYNEGVDKLTKIKLMIAAENTWQGIIYNKWFYSTTPPIINADFIPGLSKYYFIDLEEHIWNYKTGNTSFNSCVTKNAKEKNCLSIFDSRSLHVNSRLVIFSLSQVLDNFKTSL